MMVASEIITFIIGLICGFAMRGAGMSMFNLTINNTETGIKGEE